MPLSSTRLKFIQSFLMGGLLTPQAWASAGSNAGKKSRGLFLPPDEKDNYLENIKAEFNKEWPNNRRVNLVFHGHSVPSGYFRTPVVNTLHSYPFLLLKDLKEIYPLAMINTILTCIGGENSQQGAARFKDQVLNYKPDVLFIDYALNDAGMDPAISRKSMEYMVKEALQAGIKLILLTPTPDQRIDIQDRTSRLQKNSDMIIALSQQYQTGLVDNYAVFQKLAAGGEKISDYMAQVNHPNEKGHQLVSDGIMKYF